METVETVVIGAGVVGLAVARALALAGREVLVVEAAGQIGTGTSSRNSEVIHAGIYYPPGSLKARLCVAGRDRLYAYCAERAVPHRRIGKLVVASAPDQVDRLEQIRARAAACDVTDLRLLGRADVLALEPSLEATAALLSPSTGIIDAHAYMLALQGDAEDAGATFAFHAQVRGGALTGNGVSLDFSGEQDFRLAARHVVNAAGLAAHRIAGAIGGLPPGAVPAVSFAKGNYFALEGKSPFSRLVYPVPVAGGLGVHLTLDLGGQARFGPDVEWIGDGDIDYAVDPGRAAPFYDAIRRYWPALRDGALRPDYAGVRVKLDGAADSDFRIEAVGDGALVSLFGIESPGLTASLAIADHVASLIDRA